jgi:hypothetical protein
MGFGPCTEFFGLVEEKGEVLALTGSISKQQKIQAKSNAKENNDWSR